MKQVENGLVEAVAVLISDMPRLRPDLPEGNLGECYNTKPEFMKVTCILWQINLSEDSSILILIHLIYQAWEKWRAQITKLDCSSYWLQCDHQQTRVGLKNILQIMLGNASTLSNVTYHWIELYISHFLYIRPFTTVSLTCFLKVWFFLSPSLGCLAREFKGCGRVKMICLDLQFACI